jgi:hypothetical protein
MTFTEFIAPIDPILFFSDYYEKKPLLIKRNRLNFYNNLLNINDIENYLLSDTLSFNDLKVLLNNQLVPSSNYSNPSGSGIDLGKLQSYRDNGALMVMNNINRNVKKTSDFLAPIESELKTSFQCNCYLSPQNSNGFKTHFDTHDVLALQVYGKKTWAIYHSEEYLPSKIPNKETVFTNENDLKPLMTVELEEGDLLYLPRGFYHKAFTTNHPSAHIALNYSIIFGYKLISTLGKELHVNNFFRKTYPSSGFEKEAYIKQFKKELIASIEQLTTDDFDKLYQIRLDAVKQVNQFQSSTITLNSLLVRSNNTEFFIQNNKSNCSLKCGTVSIILPINYSLAISEIMNQQQIMVKDFPIEGDKFQLQLAKRLVNTGLFSLKPQID